MSSTDQNSSNTLFTSSPFDGIKGQRWHQFVQAFKAGADAEFCHEDDDSIWEACIDIDTGGNGTGATPMPTAAAALEKAERKRKKRQAKAYKLIYKHIEDERIKELLDALPRDNRRGAEAWALVVSQCKPDEDDLSHMTIRSEWTAATIEKDIGYSVSTITEWQRLLVGINAKLPPGEKYSENELTLKFLSGITTPESLAGKAVQGTKWLDACKEDMAGKARNGPNGWMTLVDLDECVKAGRTPLKGKWVFTVKYEKDGFTVKRFKARWVGCGYAQIDKIDYNETFASTIRAVTVRLLLSEIAARDFMLSVLDVKLAFTQSVMPETLYVEQPHGFEKPGKVCKLNMALEGTKQAAHLWQKNLNEFMIEYGFERCVVDPCLYKYVVGGSGSILICAVHVDDVLCGYNDANSMDDFEKAFAKRFNASRVGASTYLGAEITRDRDARTITMTQRVYIEKMASKYLVGGNTKKWTTPIDMSREGGAKFLALTVADGEREVNEMSGKDFSGLLGSLLYAACMTRPDIAYYVSFLCQFMQQPSPAAWECAISVLSYLHTTMNKGIRYGGPERECAVPDAGGMHFKVFADASFGREVHPFYGGFIEWRNGPLVWYAGKAKFAPQSSCEIETAAMVRMLKEERFAVQVGEFMGIEFDGPTACITDNKATYDIVRNPGATKRTAHFDRWLHFARELYLKNAIKIYLTTTDKMMADIMTKPTDKTTFLRCCAYILTDGHVD